MAIPFLILKPGAVDGVASPSPGGVKQTDQDIGEQAKQLFSEVATRARRKAEERDATIRSIGDKRLRERLLDDE
ncbi:hypothetical protein [Methylopila turkensis]|uniref:Uncharacterized protein n=1 Tax=Methylopila turkensis TaxID=1437816 RepID=A0A9W6JN59_9HYPH|nr:hypothetical protein [Methylopila turkensis]GLK79308.1 hypothetical protein GCM10008174_10490 [Methylopila turkensis]